MPNVYGTPVIGDLVACEQGLDITCARCHRSRYLEPLEAILLLGEETTFQQANKRLKCGACGARGRDRLIHARPSMSDYYRKGRALGWGVGE